MKRKLINLILSIIGTVLELWGWFYLGYILELHNKWYEFPFVITGILCIIGSVIGIIVLYIILSEEN